MVRSRLLAVLWLTIIALLVWLSPVRAQALPSLQIIGTVVEPASDGLGLNVFFVITDSAGRPVSRLNPESASIQLLGSSRAPVPANVGAPDSNLYIAFLLDISGSMKDTITGIRQAASSALADMPPNAFISVIAFDERSQRITSFTNDLNAVKSGIERARVTGNKGTCLYDAVFDSIEQLNQQIKKPQDRLAVVLFTDGQDTKTGNPGEPCSLHTYEDVIREARATNGIPIHAIGLCAADCSNINGDELRKMAQQTGAFWATGNAANMGPMFQQIVQGLNSQWLARAKVPATQGRNQAALTIKLRDRSTPLTSTFWFDSEVGYDQPPSPVDVRITGLAFDKAANAYTLALSVGDPETARQLVLQVEEQKGGTVVLEVPINPNGRPTLQPALRAGSLIPGRTYLIKVRALDGNGRLIERPGQSAGAQEDRSVLAQKEFTHEVTQPDPAKFTIESVTPNYEKGVLTLILNVVSGENRVQIYQGFIVNEARQRIADFGPALYPGRQFDVPLPPAIAQAQATQEYALTLYLITKDEIRSDATLDNLKFTPPPPPSILQRISKGITENPGIPLAILAIISSVVVWRVLENQRVQRKRQAPLPRPPMNDTQIFSPTPHTPRGIETPPLQPRLRLRIVETPQPPVQLEHLIVMLPFTVGRRDCDLNLPNDAQISRQHLQITFQDQAFYLKDLTSKNGTYVNDQPIEPLVPVRLVGPTMVDLGHFTRLILEPL